ncbi:MAG: phospho-N-acetylmuramoyl-pentapeptide-transferase, partial [Eubacteriales bacterium]
GIFFIVPIMLVTLFLLFWRIGFDITGKRFFFSLMLAFLCGMIGLADDTIKIVKKRNEGLRAGEKFLLQLIVAAIYLFAMAKWGGLSTSVYLPFIKKTLELGKFYYIFALILIVGVVNSVNLTDGIDGLASSVTAAVSAFFAIYAVSMGNEPCFYLAGAVFGGCFGFLVYNFHPAKVFMGDTGSLFLGGAVCAMAFLINSPLIIVFAGLVYIAEALSDILQVIYFKCTHGKRLFKMAPIHHHFERCGWSENKIGAVFTLVTIIMCIICYFLA